MRKFDQDFRTSLRDIVQDIEGVSGAEVVTTVVPHASRHLYVNFIFACVFSLLVNTLLTFLPVVYWFVYIYLETLLAFAIGFALPWFFPGIKRWVLGASKMGEQTMRMSRAIFQEYGIHETRERIGILIVFFWSERQVIMLPDKGILEMVPADEWEKLQQSFESVFKESDVAEAILKQLQASKALFGEFIPRSEDDINELTDELWLS